ncbi:hypothetical protein NEMIN01_0493 [Nematocida minor]|uniref:uncharacterized protein n=1 Tax=Nematocida minor TaxID=1912983 RepID=UPI00221EB26E|nr:uncharacterized protein NEMIN01_0493 [Nematocida minor]KAI5189430.1 hypothetical protein NEMIN01_0493 [Nematocida minor]
MILQHTLLKQIVIIGAVAVAYLQRVSCASENMDVPKDKNAFLSCAASYWDGQVAFVEKQVKIRSDFIEHVDRVTFKDLRFDGNNYMGIGKETMFEITEDLSALKEDQREMMKLLEPSSESTALIDEEQATSSSDQEKNTIQPALRDVLSKMLKRNTALIEKLDKFSSDMLKLVRNYTLLKKTDIQLDDLVLFKLAEKNRTLPTNIILSFFDVESSISAFDGKISRQKLDEIVDCLSSSSLDNKELIHSYVCTVMEDIMQKREHPLVSADKHFSTILDKYGLNLAADENIMDVYSSLLKDLAGAEISQFKDTAPNKVMKLIMIEHLMDENLLKYKKNSLFSNLEKIILSMEEKQQAKILTVLSMLWNDWYFKLRKNDIFRSDACKELNLNVYFFEKLLKNIGSFKWIYAMGMPDLDTPTSFPKNKLAKEIHFDMSYLHPMWYMCRRYESISHLDRPDPKSKGKPFMTRKNDLVTLRPHRISKIDDELTRAENMRDFMNTCFSSSPVKIKIFHEYPNSGTYDYTYNRILKCLELPLIEDTRDALQRRRKRNI